jgi:hypothetical protein
MVKRAPNLSCMPAPLHFLLLRCPEWDERQSGPHRNGRWGHVALAAVRVGAAAGPHRQPPGVLFLSSSGQGGVPSPGQGEGPVVSLPPLALACGGMLRVDLCLCVVLCGVMLCRDGCPLPWA